MRITDYLNNLEKAVPPALEQLRSVDQTDYQFETDFRLKAKLYLTTQMRGTRRMLRIGQGGDSRYYSPEELIKHITTVAKNNEKNRPFEQPLEKLLSKLVEEVQHIPQQNMIQ